MAIVEIITQLSIKVDCEHYRMRKWARVEENVTQFPTFKFFQFGSELLQTIGTNEQRMKQLIMQHGKEAKDISTKKIKNLTSTQGESAGGSVSNID